MDASSVEISMDNNSHGSVKEMRLIPLVHYKQRSNWDCGISCVLMVLPKLQRANFLDNFRQICDEENFNHSTWTIDLCYLLKRYNISCVYYTLTLGIQSSFATHRYYSEVVKRDHARVNSRFHNAHAHGIDISNCPVTLRDVIAHLSDRGPAILLTDANHLRCVKCNHNSVHRAGVGVVGRATFVSDKLGKLLQLRAGGYQGHYIALCGYDLERKLVYYRNPTYHDRICLTSFDLLEKARKSYGTDEDVILIFN